MWPCHALYLQIGTRAFTELLPEVDEAERETGIDTLTYYSFSFSLTKTPKTGKSRILESGKKQNTHL
jgi:hypothetical protein